jgi:hypothetical protein
MPQPEMKRKSETFTLNSRSGVHPSGRFGHQRLSAEMKAVLVQRLGISLFHLISSGTQGRG